MGTVQPWEGRQTFVPGMAGGCSRSAPKAEVATVAAEELIPSLATRARNSCGHFSWIIDLMEWVALFWASRSCLSERAKLSE